jgi:very-short-patch-repair endonuclease/predicted transcriptional regulator of viral defense system
MRGKGQTRGSVSAPDGADARIAVLAGTQHGVVSRTQLLNLGLSKGAIERRVRAGRLHCLHAGVYAVGHTVLSQRGRWMAGILFCGPGAVLSHRSAAALWGLRSGTGGVIDVTTPRKVRATRSIRRHCSPIPEDEVTECEGIPVTSVPRTIFDMAAISRPEAVEAMLREAEYRRLYDLLSLQDLLERYPRRHGAKAVRTALAHVGETPGRIRSPLEERFMPFLDRYALPRPHFNAWIEVGGERCQVDCLWPGPRQIVELDGWEGHGTRRAFRDDRARDRRLRVAGYGVTRIAWAQLDDEGDAIAADMRALLAGPS